MADIIYEYTTGGSVLYKLIIQLFTFIFLLYLYHNSVIRVKNLILVWQYDTIEHKLIIIIILIRLAKEKGLAIIVAGSS